MEVNSYKLGWLLAVVLIVGGLGIGIYFLAIKVGSHQPPETTNNVPPYQKAVPTGPKVISLPPYQPSSQSEKFPEINIPPQDKSLLPQGLPASSVLKAPDKPALPPNEDNVIRLILSSRGVKPTTIRTEIFQPVILRVQSQDNDYLFFVERVGVAEVVRQGQSLTVSFQAPAKASTIRYYFEDYQTKKIIGEGKLVAQ